MISGNKIKLILKNDENEISIIKITLNHNRQIKDIVIW